MGERPMYSLLTSQNSLFDSQTKSTIRTASPIRPIVNKTIKLSNKRVPLDIVAGNYHEEKRMRIYRESTKATVKKSVLYFWLEI